MQLNKFNTVLVSLFGIYAASSSVLFGNTVVGDTPLEGNAQVLLGIPTSPNDQAITISRRQYVISWDYSKRSPEWVGWTVNKRQLGASPRSDVFRLDRDLDEVLVERDQESVGPNDYKGSCLDRGHQVPSGDRTATEIDNKSTFYMSNILPQSAFLNRKTWVSLERFLRDQVENNGMHVQIYAGSIADPMARNIGPNNDIQVPIKNYKVAVLMPASRSTPSRDQMRMFVVNFPNLTSRGTNPVTDRRQACWDSDHTLRLEDTNKTAYWRPFLSNMRNVQLESGVDFSFLNDIQELSQSEVDDLIANTKNRNQNGQQIFWQFPYNFFSLPNNIPN